MRLPLIRGRGRSEADEDAKVRDAETSEMFTARLDRILDQAPSASPHRHLDPDHEPAADASEARDDESQLIASR
jgi:Mn-dependent DtxR family transcriptional regulator